MSEYKQKSFENDYSEYYSYYTKIKADSTFLNTIKDYKPVFSVLETIEWEGEGKQQLYETIKIVEKSCEDVEENTTFIANKMKICKGILYSELSTLKRKIEAYNNALSVYNEYSERYNDELNKQNNSEEVA